MPEPGAALGDKALVLDGIFYAVPELSILQGAYLRLLAGSICGLFGLNGSGKSTLLKIAAGQIQANSGITIIDGNRYHTKARYRRFKHLAYLPQNSMLPGEMIVRDIVSVFNGAALLADDEIVRKVISSRVDELSEGERRYLEVRLILSLRRDYLLLDEPFTGVEPRLIERISDAIRKATGRGSGILMTDHYHHYTVPITDDAYLMTGKQCRHLDGGSDVMTQLEEYGYLRQRDIRPQTS